MKFQRQIEDIRHVRSMIEQDENMTQTLWSVSWTPG